KVIETSIGSINYDHLVIALGADTNYFNNREIEHNAFPMKSMQESLHLRNHLLECIEKALICDDEKTREALMTIVIVGGGPTGTEVAGALSEMRKYVLPKDYPELDFNKMNILLLEGGSSLLNGMSETSGLKAKEFLEDMKVAVRLNTIVEKYDGKTVVTKNGECIDSETLIWAAGVKGNKLNGIPDDLVVGNGRIKVDGYNQVLGIDNVYAIGDIAFMQEGKFQKGHPQVAQVAIQQADRLAKNLKLKIQNKPLTIFTYKDLGSMATVGRNRAVVDLKHFSFQGFFAWAFWLFVHLMAILGVKNKLFIFMEWMWNYITFDQSLRLVIKQKPDTKISDRASE
ncbi:MAG: FAD-dependent oxidoreductase, partial [Salibacteraceae bacterium]